MNKNYNEKEIQKLLTEASNNITPESTVFDVFLSKLDTTSVQTTVYTKSVISPFTFFKLASTCTAFVLVIFGINNINKPLQNNQIANNSAVLETSSSDDANNSPNPNTLATADSMLLKSADDNTSVMSASFAKNKVRAPEIAALENVTKNTLSVESDPESELLALASGI